MIESGCVLVLAVLFESDRSRRKPLLPGDTATAQRQPPHPPANHPTDGADGRSVGLSVCLSVWLHHFSTPFLPIQAAHMASPWTINNMEQQIDRNECAYEWTNCVHGDWNGLSTNWLICAFHFPFPFPLGWAGFIAPSIRRHSTCGITPLACAIISSHLMSCHVM